MAGHNVRNNQLAGKSIFMGCSSGKEITDMNALDFATLRRYGKNVLGLSYHVYGPQVEGKIYDGTSPSKVVGTEITRIKDLDKKEFEKKGKKGGFQLYIVIDIGGQIETGLPSYSDKKSGEKRLVDLNNFDVSEMEKFLRTLPDGTKILLLWQLDVERTNDVDMSRSIVSEPGRMDMWQDRQRSRQVFEPPRPIGDGGGLFAGKSDAPDSSVLIERLNDSGEGKMISISETLLFKGTKEDPVDLGTIAKGLTEAIRSFDGTPVTLSDLQRVLFIMPGNKIPAPDAHDRITFDSDVRVGLLEVISRQQMNYSQRNALTDSFDYEGGQDKPDSPAAPIAETIRSSFNPRNPSSLPRAKDAPMEESMLMRLLMNPVERRLWGKMFGLPDEEASSAFSAPALKGGESRPSAKTIFSSRPNGQNQKNALNGSGGKTVLLSTPITEQPWKSKKTEDRAYRQDERTKKEAALKGKINEAVGNNSAKARGARTQSQMAVMVIKGKKTLAKNKLTEEKTKGKKGSNVFAGKKEMSEPKAEVRFERKKDAPLKEKSAKGRKPRDAKKDQITVKEKAKAVEGAKDRKRGKSNEEKRRNLKPPRQVSDSPNTYSQGEKRQKTHPYFLNQMLGLTSRKTRAGNSSGRI